MAHIIKKPHGLYYNGELIGIITNPDPHGDLQSICYDLSPDEGVADVRPFEGDVSQLQSLLSSLPETVPVYEDDEDYEEE
jgi:hypothetical protein